MDARLTIESAVQRLSGQRTSAVLALLALCLAVYLPGVLRLPAVDRTEIVYAETTRNMVSRGAYLDPRYGDTVHQFRPIGIYWAQVPFAWLAGEAHARDIAVYRLPGMIAVTLAVLALFCLAAPIIGMQAAFIASALFAVAPLTVLTAHLAIAEGLSLLPATIAMLALLRIYAAPRDDEARALALMFWTALGLGVLINALLVPILVGVTMIGLRVMDADTRWLRRIHLWPGLPLALLIACPWLVVRTMQDGVPFAGMDWREFIAALGGSQDMKLRAMPGTFVLALVLGFLPGTALLAPALAALWRNRDAKVARFLLAWIFGYLVYLELLSSKPGTYMVQTLFPAAAIAIAMLVDREDGKSPAPRFHALAWPPLAAVFAIALLAAPYAAMREWPSAWLWLPIAAVAALFAWSAWEGRAGHLVRWAASGVAALGLFAVTLIAGVLPSIDRIWPAREVQRAIAACPVNKVGVLGWNEPSTRFVLARDSALSGNDGLAALAADAGSALAVVTDNWQTSNADASVRGTTGNVRPVACVRALNTMRGCALNLTIFGNSATPPCEPPPAYACLPAQTREMAAPDKALRGFSACD